MKRPTPRLTPRVNKGSSALKGDNPRLDIHYLRKSKGVKFGAEWQNTQEWYRTTPKNSPTWSVGQRWRLEFYPLTKLYRLLHEWPWVGRPVHLAHLTLVRVLRVHHPYFFERPLLMGPLFVEILDREFLTRVLKLSKHPWSIALRFTLNIGDRGWLW